MAKPANLRIEDVAAATARADLNDILISIASLQTTDGAGTGYTGEPTTTYPNMLWYDKATDILKMRSEADDAWITVGNLNQAANTFAAAVALASQAEAEAGTENTKTMTALRTKQAIDAVVAAPYTASIATTTGTTRALTGIPANINQVDVFFKGVSHNNNDVSGDFLVQLGTTSGFVTSGYYCQSTTYAISRTTTAGFLVLNPGASNSFHGVMRLRRIADGTQSWIAVGEGMFEGASGVIDTWSNVITLASDLTQIRLTTAGGTPVFDAGNLSIRCYH